METISMRDFANRIKYIAKEKYNTDYYEVLYSWNSVNGDMFKAYIAGISWIEGQSMEDVIDKINEVYVEKEINVIVDIIDKEENITNDLRTKDYLFF